MSKDSYLSRPTRIEIRRGCEHGKSVSKIISRLMQNTVHQSWQTYSHHCQDDLLECHRHTTSNSYQKCSPLKAQNQWHKSCIVHNSLVSCTIPLYCVFIIPLNRIYGVGQVERSHAWTFFIFLFCRVSPKGEKPLIFIAQLVWGVTVFFVNLWVYMVIPEQPQTSTAVSAWGRGALFPHYRLCKIKNHSIRSHHFLLKHNFLPVHLLLCCRGNAGVIVVLGQNNVFL